MRLLITGKTRSGKSTALHRILSHALRMDWAGVTVFDGKGSEFHHYADLAGVRYLDPGRIDGFVAALQGLADTLPARYSALTDRGLRQAAPEDPRYLLVADEIQRATRHSEHGKAVKDALNLIAEQSAALGDVLVLSTQRVQWSIPVNTRFNCSAKLRMLGKGYFYLEADGQAKRSGRVAYVEPEESLSIIHREHTPEGPLDPEHLPEVLGSQPVEPSRGPATLYVGRPGSGKTHALRNHPDGEYPRHIYVSAMQSHRKMLVGLIERAGAVVPPQATIPDLREIACLALQAEPTLLLIDDLDDASAKTRPSVQALMEAAAETALATKRPRTPSEERRLKPFKPRCHLERLKPLGRGQARALAEERLPDDLDDREATVRRIVDLADGHPATVVDLARRVQRGSLNELRDLRSNKPRVPLSWLVILPVLAFAYIARYHANAYWLSIALLALSFLIRPFYYRAMHRLRST